MGEVKASMYQSATATIACRWFSANDIVAVSFSHRGDNGTLWFLASADGDHWVCYPEHHLTRFCL